MEKNSQIKGKEKEQINGGHQPLNDGYQPSAILNKTKPVAPKGTTGETVSKNFKKK